MIPQFVKINGVFLDVVESPRGWVRVGETTREMDPHRKNILTSQERRTGDTRPWQEEMRRLFERALLVEKTRRKGLK
jgi:hypothetical protein